MRGEEKTLGLASSFAAGSRPPVLPPGHLALSSLGFLEFSGCLHGTVRVKGPLVRPWDAPRSGRQRSVRPEAREFSDLTAVSHPAAATCRSSPTGRMKPWTRETAVRPGRVPRRRGSGLRCRGCCKQPRGTGVHAWRGRG